MIFGDPGVSGHCPDCRQDLLFDLPGARIGVHVFDGEALGGPDDVLGTRRTG